MQELDIHIDWLTNAIEDFGKKSTEALEGTAEIQGYNSMVSMDLDIMPREEVFLISSFIMNLRQAAYVYPINSPSTAKKLNP